MLARVSAINPIQRRAVAPWRFSAGTYAGISPAEIPLRDLRQQIYATCRVRGICWLHSCRGLRSRRDRGVLTLFPEPLSKKDCGRDEMCRTWKTVAVGRISSASPHLGAAKRGQGAGVAPGRSTPIRPRLPPGPTGAPWRAKRKAVNERQSQAQRNREAICD